MRLKVEMNVTDAKGQKVTTEDGEMVEGIKEVRWSANASERPTVLVELYAEKVDFDLGQAVEPGAIPTEEPGEDDPA